MLDERIVDVVSRQHGVISRKQLLAAGLSNSGIGHRVRRRRLFPVLHGVFALGPHVDVWGFRHAAVLSVSGTPVVDEPWARTRPALPEPPPLSGASCGGRVPPPGRRSAPVALVGTASVRVALSHWSALDLHRLIDEPPKRFHVTIEGTGGRTHAAVHVHRARTLHSRDVQLVDRLPVTTPARTILDSALGASVGQVRRLIREAEYRELLEIGAMADVVRRNPFHPASPIVRRADPDTAESRRLQTPIEDRMAAIIDGLPIGLPTPQAPVTGQSGRTYRADFAWGDLRLIVEADGRSSHDRSTSFQSDRDRDADLAAAGWLTLRFTSLQLDDPNRVTAMIVATASTRS